MAVLSRLALAASLACGAVAQQVPLGHFNTDAQVPISKGAEGDVRALIDTEALQSTITAEALEKRAEKLFGIAKLSEEDYNHPTRVIGSPGHIGTLQYVVNTLLDFDDYYNVELQDFDVTLSDVYESQLTLGDAISKTAVAMSMTPATKDREPVHGRLVVVNNVGCAASDFPISVQGNIALIMRGKCAFGDKSGNAGKAGAVAAVIYNSDDDELNGTLGDPTDDHVATFGISGAEGKGYVERIKKGEKIDAIAYVDAVVKTITTTNVIAQTTEGDPDNVVMLGGHSDSVEAGPGINDDGSGSISILEVAAQLTKFKVNNAVRFAWWAGEEEGLLGSNYYAYHLSEEENQKIRLFMDYDMMASPNWAMQVYNATNDASPTGSEELRDLYVDWYQEHGFGVSFIPFDGRSDYQGFIDTGIPAGGIATGAEGVKTPEEEELFGGHHGHWYDHCYHMLCDDLTNVNYTAWVANTKLIAHSVATYAKSFQGFPKRVQEASVKKSKPQHKYRGHKLAM